MTLVEIVTLFTAGAISAAIGYAAGRRSRSKGFHSGGLITHVPDLDVPALLSRGRAVEASILDAISAGKDSIRMQLLGKFRSRSNFHPTTRRVLEVLDRAQKPEVDQVLHPVADAIMPEIRHRYLGVALREIRQGQMVRESDIQQQGFYESNPGDDALFQHYTNKSPWDFGDPKCGYEDQRDATELCRSRLAPRDKIRHLAPDSRSCCLTHEGEPHLEGCEVRAEIIRSHEAEQLAHLDALFGGEGEPLPTPPAPNLGGDGHPPYQGPNYTPADELADELKGIMHYGTEKSE